MRVFFLNTGKASAAVAALGGFAKNNDYEAVTLPQKLIQLLC